jgi:peroxiredoxin
VIDENEAPFGPNFSAIDSEGKSIQLSDFKGKKKVVLVFNRGFF